MVKLGQMSLLCSLLIPPTDSCFSKGDYCGVSFKEFFFSWNKVTTLFGTSPKTGCLSCSRQPPSSTMTLTHNLWSLWSATPIPSFSQERRHIWESFIHSRGIFTTPLLWEHTFCITGSLEPKVNQCHLLEFLPSTGNCVTLVLSATLTLKGNIDPNYKINLRNNQGW